MFERQKQQMSSSNIESTATTSPSTSIVGNSKRAAENGLLLEEEDDEDCWDDAKEDQQYDIAHQPSKPDQRSVKMNYIQSIHNDHGSRSQQQQSLSNSATDECGTSSGSGDDKLASILHEAVFYNDANRIYDILKNENLAKELVNKKDKHGNTPLALACMLGRSKEIIGSLLSCGASVDAKNLQRWTPFHEACSYGNRDVLTLMVKQLQSDLNDVMNKNKEKLAENLSKTKNYRLVLKWEFQSWVPFLTRVLPSDVCVITKQGSFIRIDTKLLDYEMLSWKKDSGESCLIYSNKFKKKWVIMNMKAKKYQHFAAQSFDRDIDSKVDEFISTDIIDIEVKSSDIQLTRSTCGWIWKADRMEKVGRYNAALYNFNNVFLVTRKRREHLNDEDIKRNKLAYKGAMHVLKFGKKPSMRDLEEASNSDSNNTDNDNIENSQQDDDLGFLETSHRESLSPPPATNVTWEEYLQAEAGKFPNLGREQKIKVVKTAFKASVAMSDEFPITKNEFLDLLSIIPLRLFKKLKEFIELRLPDGFPVRLDIPVFPFLTARITFEDFAFIDGPVDERLFTIPCDFSEDQNLFPFFSAKRQKDECDKSGAEKAGVSGNEKD